MKNKLLDKIDKAYGKRAKQLNKNFLQDNKTGLFIFVEQLKYLRDTLVIKAYETDSEELSNIASAILIAIAEFEAYTNSTDKEQREFHWNNFWEFIKLNLEEWLVLNDTV